VRRIPRHPLLVELADANRNDLSTERRRDPDEPDAPSPAADSVANRPRKPAKPDPDAELRGMMADPLYWSDKDPEYRAHVLSQFEAVYGTEPVQRDATGRMRQPRAKPDYRAGIARVAAFSPRPRLERFATERNRRAVPLGRTKIALT
jgi:hypothetical protein